jgi:hypothetical protein
MLRDGQDSPSVERKLMRARRPGLKLPETRRAPTRSAAGRVLARSPLLAAFVPDPDVWRVAGAGRTLVARRRADGRVAWASLLFDLKRPRSTLLFGSLESDEGAFEEIVESLVRIEDAVPVVGGSQRLAARFTFGALAYVRGLVPEIAPDEGASLLSVFERPAGGVAEHHRAFAGKDGLCTPDLLRCVAREVGAELGADEALPTQVAMTFAAADPAELARALAADPDFVAAEPGELAWAPARGAGKRLGHARLHGSRLEAETVSLELAGVLCARLKRLAGTGGLELTRLTRRPL